MRHRTPLHTALIWGLSCASVPLWAAENGKYSFHEVNILGTSLDLVVVVPGSSEAERARTAVLGEIERLRRILSSYDVQTDLGRLNDTRDPLKVASELITVLRLYEQWCVQSHGTYSAGTGSLANLWKHAESENREPDPAVLKAAADAARGPLWRIDEQTGAVTRTSDTQINIDSLGKGYIVSQALEAARKQVPSMTGAMLNIGGDISTWGTSEPGRKLSWPIKVANPRETAENADPLVELQVTGLSVASSGAYARGYTIAGKRFSHIIDARTGRAVETDSRTGRDVIAVTVIASDNPTANALATSLCMLSAEEGLALVKATPGTGCLLVLANGNRLRSPLFREFEVIKPDAPAEPSTIADAPGARWPSNERVTLTLQIKPQEERASERPYVAVWVEDEFGQHVTTLAMWGNEARWLPSMSQWWKFAHRDKTFTASVTRATRPAGHYELMWDGKDQHGRPVPAGTYTLWVETRFEHGGHIIRSAPLACGNGEARAEVAESDHFKAVILHYGAKKE